jgi:hypothetical protein
MFDIEREIRTGETQRVGDMEITPQSKVLKIQSRGGHFGFIWNRPKSVIVRTDDGQESILPVRDVTRNIIWGMLAGSLLGAIMIGMMYRMNSMGKYTKE